MVAVFTKTTKMDIKINAALVKKGISRTGWLLKSLDCELDYFQASPSSY